jgi:DNA-binding NtrC family response regulator
VPGATRLQAACAALGLIGRAPPFRDAIELTERLAASAAPVLIRGPTGSGKELFARCIHYLSDRQAKPFIPINCGAIPDMLLESELFGHIRGSFTDARQDQRGLVALAEGGTLFLDEVDTLSPKAQVTLLRFLQDREYRPVGGRTILSANVRVVAASNADLREAVGIGKFRQDLLFRLDVLGLDIPGLSERQEDIVLLARFFLSRFAALYALPVPALTAAAQAWLVAQPWPGNIRELENRMHRALLLSDRGAITPSALGMSQKGPAGSEPSATALYAGGFKAARTREMRTFEARYLRALMTETKGNVSEAARRAGTERRAMGRLLKRHGLDRQDFF